MHAIVAQSFGDPSVLKWVEQPDPQPEAGKVAIRVSLTGVNFADVMARQGKYHSGTKPPFIPGFDCVGTIVGLGEGVTGLKVGQRVCAFPAGTYAEIVIASAQRTYPIGDDVSDEIAASVLMLVTAYNCLTLAARITSGESILIHSAAGGVGLVAVQMAKKLGASRIIATASTDEKLALAKQAGADTLINYTKDDAGKSVLAATDGRGVDVILDAVAGDVFDNSLQALATFGRYVIYGIASGKPGTVQTNYLHPENRAVVGYSTGNYLRVNPEAMRPGVNASLKMAADGINITVGARYPLAKAADAHELVESRRSHGKVILQP
jgi:NADPH2:quinone reductase